MNTPPQSASSKVISGSGLAIANTIDFYFIFFTISFVNVPGPETPMKTSAFIITSPRAPFSFIGLVILDNLAFQSFIPQFLPQQIAPFVSTIIILLAPCLINSLQIVIPAAPTPVIIILTSCIFFSANFRAFMRAARVTIEVPCWSSWKTGKIFLFLIYCQMKKHSGDLISSRLIALKYEAISNMASMDYWYDFLLLMQTGTTFTPPRTLKSNDLPSITGSPARGPISPKPKIAVPSVTIALSCWQPPLPGMVLEKLFKFSSVKQCFSSLILWKVNQIWIFPQLHKFLPPNLR